MIGKNVRRECLQCNSEFYVYPSQLKRGGRFCSVGCGTTYRNLTDNPSKRPEVRKKISDNHAFPYALAPYWKFGKENPNYKPNAKSTYRKRALEFYGDTCQRCESDCDIQVHHVDRDRANNELNNLEVLCQRCHQKEHEDEHSSRGRCPKTGRFMRGVDVNVQSVV